jgi:aspartate racemase
MKTIGLLGGMSWQSSVEYYRIINETVQTRLGGLHSAKCVMYSVDFAEIEPLQRCGEWTHAADLLIAAAGALQAAGADSLVLCTNTMHKLADEVQGHVKIPLLHIADAAARRIKAQGIGRVGLLGTSFTMEEDFYRGRLIDKHGIDVIVPERPQREIIHRVIYEELCRGRIEPSSRGQYVKIMDDLVARGAEGIILGCTEIGLLVGGQYDRVPLFDTTEIHAVAAAEQALET